MTRVYNLDTLFIISDKATALKILEGQRKDPISEKDFGALSIIELASDKLQSLELYKRFPDESILKILDKYYLVMSEDHDISTKIIGLFFDHIGKQYADLIDLNRNVSNIQAMLKYLTLNSIKDSINVLDFGCGIGLSYKAKEEMSGEKCKINLFGYDISPKMLRAAQKAGIKVLNKSALEKVKEDFFDGIIASYSMHFVQDVEILEVLWSKLKAGGKIVANFHKDIGVKKIVSVFKSKDADIELLEKSDHGSIYSFTKTDLPFIKADAIATYFYHKCSLDILPDFFEILKENNVLPTFKYDDCIFVLKNDLDLLLPFLRDLNHCGWENVDGLLHEKHFIIRTPSVRIEFKGTRKNNLTPEFISLFKNLLTSYDVISAKVEPFSVELNGIISIKSLNEQFTNYLKAHLQIIERVEESKATLFSNSASYMGSKKNLRAFIVESIYSIAEKDSVVFDLMCGSGSVSGAFSLFWKTYVSDAMKFSRILAKIQGGGYTLTKAKNTIEQINNNAIGNLIALTKMFEKQVSSEDRLFHSQITPELKSDFDNFCRSFPSLVDGSSVEMSEYSRRKMASEFPYLLFTCCYSNLYIGVRQAIEIDSCRFAIEQLPDRTDRSWALGALLTTLSAVGNTYGGHFAQPKFKNVLRLSDRELFGLIEQRSISVIAEFAVRLRELALESEAHKAFEIQECRGPWQIALAEFISEVDMAIPNIVYVDAPYTRDEYSRYYHILETLVKYDYPITVGIGRVPNKKLGQRFNSEFFTKNSNRLKAVYIEVLSSIVNRGLICAWSYSDNATISSFEIIQKVHILTNCKVQSFATPYVHQAQGGSKSKRIQEYLVLFTPANKESIS